MKAPWSLAPLAPFALAFMVGIAIAAVIPWLWLVLLPAVAAVGLWLAGEREWTTVTLAMALGWADGIVGTPNQLPTSLEGIAATYSARTVTANETDFGYTLTVDIDSAQDADCTPFRAMLFVPSHTLDILPGDRICFSTRLQQLDDTADLPDEATGASLLRRQGVTCSAFLPPDSIKAVSGASVRSALSRCSRMIVRRLASSGLSDGASSFLATTLVGDDSLLPDTSRRAFSRTGLAHMLALSGLHVGLVAAMLLWLLLPLQRLRLHRTRYIAAITLLWTYAALTGMGASVTRATIMATLMLGSLALSRRRSPVNSLCAAAIIILALRPAALFTPGFQLSFASVAAILLLTPKLIPFSHSQRIPYALSAAVAVPLSAMLATATLGACYFHTLPTWFLLSNVAASLLLGPLLATGMVVAAMPWFTPAVWLANWLWRLMDWLVKAVDSLPFGAIEGVWMPPVAVAAWIGALACLVWFLHMRRRAALLCCGGMLICFTLLAWPQADALASEVYFTRSKQSTQIVVRDGLKLLIVTTAKPPDRPTVEANARRRYANYMLRRGITALEIAPDTFATPMVTRCGNLLTIEGSTYLLHHTNTESLPDHHPHPHYLIVCRGFRGRVNHLAANAEADTLLLSSDLDARRMRRYATDLTQAGIPWRLLR